MKKALILVLAALVIPSVALAARPAPNASGGNGNPKVTYILKGTLSDYSPYDAGTSTNGSITILVQHSNYHAKALVGQTLTFAVNANTKVGFADGVTGITNGDFGKVKVRAPKKIAAADLASTLQTYPARHIFDYGAPS